MYLDWIFKPLGIEETKDKKRIRKAYAQKIKECHPEEHPEEWQRLHQAYKEALNYASGKYLLYYDEEEIEEDYSEEPTEQIGEVKDFPADVELSPQEKTEPTQKDVFDKIVERAEIINNTEIDSITYQLENLIRLNGESLHMAWRDFFNSEVFLEFYKERSVIDLLGTTLKEVQVFRETAELIQNELELVIRKLVASKKYYKADLLAAIKKDFEDRISLNVFMHDETKSKWDYPEVFEELARKAERYNDPYISDVFQQLKSLRTLSAYSSYGAWIKFFESSSIKECYSDGEILETLGEVLQNAKMHSTTAEYILDMLEQFLEELESSGREEEANSVKIMQQGLQSRFHLLPPKEKEKRKAEKEKRKGKMFAGRKWFLITCGIVLFGFIALSFMWIVFFSLAFYLIIVTVMIIRAIFSIKDIVYWIREKYRNGF